MVSASITSSNILAASHSDKGLTIQFTNGSFYLYPDAGRKVYDDLVSAPSAGKFFHANIKGMPFRKVENLQ